MKQATVLAYEFVQSIPEKLEERTLYVSMDFATIVHKCCCGCGREVVTPLSPTDWKLTYDGVSISLSPSIGNWSFDCKSHYWIVNNTVKWADQWSAEQIEAGREQDRRTKQKHYPSSEATAAEGATRGKSWRDFWSRLWEWFSG